jgi:hypothetical protein
MSWTNGYNPETKHKSSEWKSPYSPRPKKGHTGGKEQEHIILLDIKGIVHNEFILAAQTANSEYYC